MKKFRCIKDVVAILDPLFKAEKVYNQCGFSKWAGYELLNEKGTTSYIQKEGNAWFEQHFEEVKDMFGKKDLKSGMVVEFRNGNKYLFVGSVPHYNEKNNSTYMIGINDKLSFMNLSNHDESMKSVSANREWDVVKVYNLSDQCDMSVIMMNADLIWQRQEKSPAELELEEAEKDMERAIERVKNAKTKIKEEK